MPNGPPRARGSPAITRCSATWPATIRKRLPHGNLLRIVAGQVAEHLVIAGLPRARGGPFGIEMRGPLPPDPYHEGENLPGDQPAPPRKQRPPPVPGQT